MAIRNRGRIIAINAAREATAITLDNDPKVGPKDNAWLLRRSHENYNALFSLALAAAVNRLLVTVRIEGDDQIDPEKEAGIRNLSVTWKD